MSRGLVVFEDARWRSLRPLTDLTSVPALRLGAATLAERWQRRAGVPLLAIEARATVIAAWHEPPATAGGADEALVVNAAALPGPWLERAFGERVPALFLGDGRVAAARLPFETLRVALGRGEAFEAALLGLGLPGSPVDARFVSHPWDLVAANAAAIEEDLAGDRAELLGTVHRLACLENPGRIRIEEGAIVGPLAVLDATGGPIRIGRGARIAAHSLVVGPCVVGAGTQILGGSVARSSLGPECRIAGEVEECVWQGWANKRHHGFVGHSAVGEWVNLGALTTTSDLKNNYGPVRVHVDGEVLDSGSTKVGSFLGAHVKTGIGTLLPTGASVGAGANLFGGGRFAPKAVPAFGWWDGDDMREHRIDRFIETARVAFSRRGRTFGAADERAARALFDSTVAERRTMTDSSRS